MSEVSSLHDVDACLESVEKYFPTCFEEISAILSLFEHEVEVRVQPQAQITLVAKLTPHAEDPNLEFCSATVVLQLSERYPQQPLTIAFRALRGLQPSTEAAFKAELKARHKMCALSGGCPP